MTQLANNLRELDINGVVHLKNVFNKEQINIMQTTYTQSWNEIKSNFPSDWITRQYKQNSHKYDDYMALNLYNGIKFAYYKNTELLDMGQNRFDFIYNLDIIKKLIELPDNIINIMDNVLGCEYDIRWGGLPVEQISDTDTNTDTITDSNEYSNGYWHRDAYSLFNDEATDLSLPPFYYTMLIPLQYTDKSNGGTEFVIGSHKSNLTNMNIDNYQKLQNWINTDANKFVPELDVGDICIFHGYTIHRGLYNKISENRDMLYIVCKKNWYNDEPIENYNEQYN